MAVIDGNTGRMMTQTTEEIDYVAGDNIYIKQATRNILVGSADDQDLLVGYTPGSYAHTAGWVKIWELDVDGTTWVSVLE